MTINRAKFAKFRKQREVKAKIAKDKPSARELYLCDPENWERDVSQPEQCLRIVDLRTNTPLAIWESMKNAGTYKISGKGPNGWVNSAYKYRSFEHATADVYKFLLALNAN